MNFLKVFLVGAVGFSLGGFVISTAVLPRDYDSYTSIKKHCVKAGYSDFAQCFNNLKQRGECL